MRAPSNHNMTGAVLFNVHEYMLAQTLAVYDWVKLVQRINI